jgi:hypothetical protein
VDRAVSVRGQRAAPAWRRRQVGEEGVARAPRRPSQPLVHAIAPRRHAAAHARPRARRGAADAPRRARVRARPPPARSSYPRSSRDAATIPRISGSPGRRAMYEYVRGCRFGSALTAWTAIDITAGPEARSARLAPLFRALFRLAQPAGRPLVPPRAAASHVPPAAARRAQDDTLSWWGASTPVSERAGGPRAAADRAAGRADARARARRCAARGGALWLCACVLVRSPLGGASRPPRARSRRPPADARRRRRRSPPLGPTVESSTHRGLGSSSRRPRARAVGVRPRGHRRPPPSGRPAHSAPLSREKEIYVNFCVRLWKKELRALLSLSHTERERKNILICRNGHYATVSTTRDRQDSNLVWRRGRGGRWMSKHTAKIRTQQCHMEHPSPARVSPTDPKG